MARVASDSAGGGSENATPPDALIIGHYGFRNLGDEAILAGMLGLLREEFPRGRWTVVSGDPPDTRARHGVAAIDRTHVPAVLSAAYRAGMVIVGGGGLLSDQYGFRPQHVLSREAGDIPGYLGPALAAAAVGRPVVLWGVGVGPFIDDRSRRWVRATAQVASACTVRTRQDRAELESLGVEDPVVVGDPAWLVQQSDLPPDLNAALSGLRRPLVAVAPRSWGAEEARAGRERALAEALDLFCERRGGSVLFVPMQELGSDEFDDRRCCERIMEQMSAADVHVTSPDLDPGQLITAFGRCELALNMRLHGTILAAMGRTPSVSISYDPKVARMASGLGLERWCLPDQEVTRDGLLEALESVWKNYPDLAHFVYVGWESMLAGARRILPLLEQVWSGASEAAPSTDYQAVLGDITLALTRNLNRTQIEFDHSRADNLELRNRLIRRDDALRSTRDRLEATYDQLEELPMTSWKLPMTSTGSPNGGGIFSSWNSRTCGRPAPYAW